MDTIAEDRDAIGRWMRATDTVAERKSQLTSAECELSNARNALGKRLCPADAKEGEAFSIWYGDQLVTVTLMAGGEYKAETRRRDRHVRYQGAR